MGRAIVRSLPMPLPGRGWSLAVHIFMWFWALLKFEMMFCRNRRGTLLPESIHILTFRYLHGLPTEIHVVITNSADNFSAELATWGFNSFSPPHCFPGSLRTRGSCLSRASQGGMLPSSIADLKTRGGVDSLFLPLDSVDQRGKLLPPGFEEGLGA